MKSYYEYEDGTFWAILTAGGDCFIIEGNKYEYFDPESMLKAGSEENWRMPPNKKKILFENPETAEQEAAKTAAEKSISAIKQDAEFWRIAIEINALLLFFVPDEYLTPELCSLAVGRNGMALKYVPLQMRSREMNKQAVYNNWTALMYVNEDERTEEMCRIAVDQCGSALKYVPEKFKTAELCFIAVKDHGFSLKYVPEKLRTPRLCAEAVKEESRALKYVPEAVKTKKLCFYALSPRECNLKAESIEAAEEEIHCALAYVPQKFITKELCFYALADNLESLKFVPDKLKTYEFCLKAVKKYGWALEYVSEEQKTYELCLAAVKRYGRALEFVPEKYKTAELLDAALKSDGYAIKFVPEEYKSREICLDAIKKNSGAIKYIPDTIKIKDFYEQAFSLNIYVFQDIPIEFITEQMCEKAYQEYGAFSEYIPAEYRSEKIITEAIKRDGYALRFTDEIQKTEQLCLLAVKKDGGALKYVPYKLRTAEICLAAVNDYGGALEYVPEALKTTELCFTALKKKPKYIMMHIPEKIRTSDFYAKWLIEAETLSPFQHIIPKSMIEEIYKKAVEIDSSALAFINKQKREKTADDKESYKNLMDMSREKRRKKIEYIYDITDIENEVCNFYYKITKRLRKNTANEWGRENCKKEKELLEDFLSVRRSILDENFTWTENYKKQFLELNNKVMSGFTKAYEEARTQFRILKERMNRNDPYLKGFNIKIKLIPFILEPDEEENYILTEQDTIYGILLDMLPDTLWTDDVYYEHDDIDNLRPGKHENNEINCNVHFGKGIFDNSFICHAMYDLYIHSKNILSWYDILKINEIWAEVKVTHQHFIENIGKGIFWDNGIQSLSDNEAENYRQTFMSRLSPDMTGLPVDIWVDEMNYWEKIGPFRRVKFQGRKTKKIDNKSLYSMSIEENPRVLVKDTKIDLTNEELQQVKDFVSGNRELLISIAEGNICVFDIAKGSVLLK